MTTKGKIIHTGTSKITVQLVNDDRKPIIGALVTIASCSVDGIATDYTDQECTDQNGYCVFNAVPKGTCKFKSEAFTLIEHCEQVTIDENQCEQCVCLTTPITLRIIPKRKQEDCTLSTTGCYRTLVGSTLYLIAEICPDDVSICELIWSASHKANLVSADTNNREMLLTLNDSGLTDYSLTVVSHPIQTLNGTTTARMKDSGTVIADEPPVQPISGEIKTTTTLTRTETSFTPDIAFWTGIRNSTEALSFNNYLSFMDWIFCGGDFPSNSRIENSGMRQNVYNMRDKRFLPFTDTDAYRVVKAATETFVMVNCGVVGFNPTLDNAYLDRSSLSHSGGELSAAFNKDYLVSVDGNEKVLPYLAVIRKKLPDISIKSTAFENAVPRTESMGKYIQSLDQNLDNCFGILQDKLANPCLLELIWSYWHEEGMLVQSMNAITRRFQNVRSSDRDPLANMEMDPLRPLNNLLWGYIQDEQHRLNVSRRNYEYDHHYGLRLEGKAVQNFRPADTRSKFLEAFHHLLRLCTVFYKQDDDTTVKADAFPILNALKEVHLILSQGAHNQFGDLPSTARIEMLMQQWLLARPEFREFLPTRVMVAYPEPWMDRVDAMKKIQGWTDTSVAHFHNLGMFGEQLLLSIRWGNWSVEYEPVKAFNWARFHRPYVQGYNHAYRAATSVDLSADPTVNASVDSTLPSVLLQKQLASQQRRAG